MFQRIKDIDVFGKPFSFHLTKGSKYYQTLPGGVITIIGTSLFIFLSIWTLSKLRDTSSPVISENMLKLKQPALLNLTKHDVATTFWFRSGLDVFNEPWKVPRHFTLKRRIITTKRDSEDKIIEETFREVPVDHCKQNRKDLVGKVRDFAEKNPHAVEPFLLNVIMDAIYCGGEDPSIAFLGLDKSNGVEIRIETELYPCSLPDPRNCATLQELSKVIIKATYFGKVADFARKQDPYDLLVRNFGTPAYVNPRSMIRFTQYFKESFVYDNSRDFFGKRLRGSAIEITREWLSSWARASGSIYCTQKQIDERICEPYLVHIAKSSKDRTEFYRDYTKLFGSFSEIGGYIDLIIYSLWAVYLIYNTRRYHKWMRSQLVDHYIELEQKKGSLQRKRTKMEIKAFEEHVKSQMNPSGNKKNKNLTFELLFESKFNSKNLLQLNFKSEILLQIFANPVFDTLALKTMVDRKVKKIKKIGKHEKVLIRGFIEQQARSHHEMTPTSSRAEFLKKLKGRERKESLSSRRGSSSSSRLQGFLAGGHSPQIIFRKSCFFSKPKSPALSLPKFSTEEVNQKTNIEENGHKSSKSSLKNCQKFLPKNNKSLKTSKGLEMGFTNLPSSNQMKRGRVAKINLNKQKHLERKSLKNKASIFSRSSRVNRIKK